MPSSCEDGLVIAHYTGRKTSLKQTWQYGDYGIGHAWNNAKLESQQDFLESLSISLKCEPIDSYIAHILQVKYTGFSSYSWKSKGTYPDAGQFNYENSGSNRTDNDTGEFLILHTTEDVNPILLPPLNTWAQRLAWTGTLSRSVFVAILGNIKGIKAWVSANSNTISESGEKPALNFFGTESFEYSSFSGWEIDCIIPRPELDKYPFCGGHIIGEEEKGIVYRNLCSNPFGICNEDLPCCDCCAIGERFLQVFKI